MRQTLTLLIVLFYSASMFAQTNNRIFEHISANMAEGKWAEATMLFHQAMTENIVLTDEFFWKEVDPNCEGRRLMALDLGNYYRDKRSYDKASLCFSEVDRLSPNDVNCLSARAEITAMQGREKDALELYGKILSIDAGNLPANIFVGNYYYLQADNERVALDHNFQAIAAPNRMQYARYRGAMEELVNTEYARAKLYLERVILRFPSAEIKKTLGKIERVKLESLK